MATSSRERGAATSVRPPAASERDSNSIRLRLRESFFGFLHAFPDEQAEAVQFQEDGEWAIWEWTGWSPQDERLTVLHGCGFFLVRDGRIVLWRGYWDKLTLLRAHQLPLDAAVRG